MVALTSFGIWETRIAEPMVPLRLFKQRNFSGGSFSLTLVQIGNGGLLLVMTQYLQFVLGFSPLKASLCFIPLAVAALIFNTVCAGLGMKFGNRPLMFVGLLICAAAFGILADLWARRPDQAVRSACSCSARVRPGDAGRDHRDHGGGPAGTRRRQLGPERHGQQTGAALGVAIMGTVVASRFTRDAGQCPGTARHSLGEASP